MEAALVRAQHYLLTEDGAVFFFDGVEGSLPEVSGEQPLILDYVEGVFCLVCGQYCMSLTDDLVRHFKALAERGLGDGGKPSCLIVGARLGFVEYRIEPLFDFRLSWTAIERLASFYELEQARIEELKNETEEASRN